MTELRWILGLIGVLFLAALAWWELRKTRGAAPARETPPRLEPIARENALRAEPPLRAAAPEPAFESRAPAREPPLRLPEIRVRESARELPVVEIAPDLDIEVDFEDAPLARSVPPVVSPVYSPSSVTAPASTPTPRASAASASAPVTPPAPAPAPAQVQVEWPGEAERMLVGVRLVAPLGQRYAGDELREALEEAGFVHGKFGIFHFPGPQRRAIFSAASLTKPGTFDLDAMDGQRFAGLSLFAVLPGPLPNGETIDKLLECARGLAERIGGALQDERGQPLSPARAAELRRSVEGRAA